MGRGNGVSLTLPSGHRVQVSETYRYALVVDANAGSWVERRAHSAAPILARIRAQRGSAVRGLMYVFDVRTGERYPAARWRGDE